MRYFAKYLPVEGEIKIGDYFFANQLVRRCVDMKEGDYPYKDETGSWHSKNWSKNRRQLFLCSRDIQIGDIVHGEEGLLYNQPKLIVADGEVGPEIGNWANVSAVNRPFKVLGSISPNAIWVREGDDILSKNVHRGSYKMGHKEWMVVDAEDEAEEWEKEPSISINGWAKCYLIEGPCGHWH